MSHRHKSLRKAKRYQSMSRMQCSFVQQTPKKIPAYRFCGSTEPGERISSCKKRAKLQGYSTEYTLGSDHNGLFNFVTKIEHSTNFEMSIPIPTNIITIGENSKSRHFFIHKCWCSSVGNVLKVNIDDLIFEFSYINKMGEVENFKNHISGRALYSMLVACNLKRGPFFVYDATPCKRMNSNTTNEIPQENNNCQNHITNLNQQTTGLILYGSGNSLSQISYSNQLTQNSFTQMSGSNHILYPTNDYFGEQLSQF